MKKDILHKVVSPLSNIEDLYIVVGLQPDIKNNETVAVIMKTQRTVRDMFVNELIVHEDKTVQDVFPAATSEQMFCYHCLLHTRPTYMKATSEYTTDIEKLPILTFLPHCPVCGKELYSKDYDNLCNDFREFLKLKYSVDAS